MALTDTCQFAISAPRAACASSIPSGLPSGRSLASLPNTLGFPVGSSGLTGSGNPTMSKKTGLIFPTFKAQTVKTLVDRVESLTITVHRSPLSRYHILGTLNGRRFVKVFENFQLKRVETTVKANLVILRNAIPTRG
ncbi:hypothetical protein Tco_1003230 [Tanacetum coccineum]|uniref:Uncharacterized protein n=1 Tax=Tanacetum coccineum TaxID=301880 RepID=A0ABQ5FAD8_9ASTR